jgi:DNA topoisomerase IA
MKVLKLAKNVLVSSHTCVQTQPDLPINLFLIHKIHIKETFGKEYLGKYKTSTSKNQQDAHEAIRPTSIKRTPEST